MPGIPEKCFGLASNYTNLYVPLINCYMQQHWVITHNATVYTHAINQCWAWGQISAVYHSELKTLMMHA